LARKFHHLTASRYPLLRYPFNLLLPIIVCAVEESYSFTGKLYLKHVNGKQTNPAYLLPFGHNYRPGIDQLSEYPYLRAILW